MNGLRRTLAATALALLAAAAPAAAEPARSVALGGANLSVTWEDSGQGFATLAETDELMGCQPVVNECVDSLLKLEQAGSVAFTTKGDGSPTLVDADISLYESDASGAPGKFLKESAGGSPEENLTAELDPGFYIIRTSWATGAGTVTVEGKLEAAAPEVPAAGGTPAPANAAPSSAIALKAKTAKKGKLKRFSGTATDDGSVAKVEVGLLQVNGGKCKQLNVAGKFVAAGKCAQPSTFLAAKGTAKWSLTLKRALAKGKYVVFSRAIDDKGAVEGGFGKLNKKSFSVR